MYPNHLAYVLPRPKYNFWGLVRSFGLMGSLGVLVNVLVIGKE